MASLPVLQQTPECFGSQLHDPRQPECAGGVDLMYTNKFTGSHVRERCRFFDACGAKVQATRAAAIQAMSPQYRPVVSAAASRAQVPQMSQQMAPPTQQQQQMQPVVQGQWYPAPTYQFNHGIPNYLTMPEPRASGESIWVALFRELLRGVIKSFGHTVAYFVDTTPMKRLPPPGGE